MALGMEGAEADDTADLDRSCIWCISCLICTGAVEKMEGFSKYEYGRGWKEIIGSTDSYESIAKFG